MAPGRRGADPEQLEALATRFDGLAEDLVTLVADLKMLTRAAAWSGDDAEAFRSDLDGVLAPEARRAAELVRSSSERLRSNAQDQREASGDGSAGTGGTLVGAGARIGGPAWTGAPLGTAAPEPSARILPSFATLVPHLVARDGGPEATPLVESIGGVRQSFTDLTTTTRHRALVDLVGAAAVPAGSGPSPIPLRDLEGFGDPTLPPPSSSAPDVLVGSSAADPTPWFDFLFTGTRRS